MPRVVIDTTNAEAPRRPARLQVVDGELPPGGGDDDVATSWRWIDLRKAWETKGFPIVATIGCTAGDVQFCLFYPGRVNSVYGKYEAGKTWLMKLAIVQQVVAGNHVLYLDFEDDENSLIGDLLRLGLTLDQIHELVHYASIEDACDPESQHWLLDEAKSLGVTLVIIDGTTEAMSLEHLNTSSGDDYATFTQIYAKRLAKLGPAVVLLDHTAKSDKQGDSQIGTQHKGAAISGAQYFMRAVTKEPLKKGCLGKSNIYLRKDRPGSVRPFEADPETRWVAQLVLDSRSADGTSQIFIRAVLGDDEPQKVSLKGIDNDIVRYFTNNQEKWCSAKDVHVNAVPGVEVDTVKRHLDDLYDSGQHFIERKQAHSRATVYFGYFPEDAPDVPEDSDDES